MTEDKILLTKYSHGGGCGCKIAPQVLDQILHNNNPAQQAFKNLLVGNSSKDDAAVFQINEKQALISTTDFFMPIVNDPFTFGKVAAANAISDVYAMGGQPVMALALLGWPIEKLPVEVAQKVMEGARTVCAEAGIPIAGGHSIDSPEPIFGLAVSGLIEVENVKANTHAQEGDLILLTQKIGVGVLATAEKRGLIQEDERTLFYQQLCHLNKIGAELGQIPGVHAMTDVTGFGLGGHLIEMAEGSGLTAVLEYPKIPILDAAKKYLSQSVMPDATYRNWNSYGSKILIHPEVEYLEAFQILPDPQTNGGLLISVAPSSLKEVQEVLTANGYTDFIEPIGVFTTQGEKILEVKQHLSS